VAAAIAPVTAALLATASGALITAVAFELFEDAFEHGGASSRRTAFSPRSPTVVLRAITAATGAKNGCSWPRPYLAMTQAIVAAKVASDRLFWARHVVRMPSVVGTS
jgi:hypothetical protein